jgi:capsular polysaccharide export protein
LKALGQAIFDMPGLTFQGQLDAFWCDGTKPDASLYRALRSVVIATAQVNGNFFTDHGMAMAIAGVLKRLAVDTVTAPAVAAAVDMTSHEVRSSKPVPIVS